MRRHRLLAGLVVLAGVLAVLALRAHTGSDVQRRPRLPGAIVQAARGDRLIIEPDAGPEPIDQLLASPRRSLDLTMYELRDPAAEAVLATDARRGVRVRVILDQRLEGSRNAAAAAYLKARGVAVHFASRRFFVSHEKAFVIDGRTLVVMTLNLDAEDYATTRDVAVVDADRRDAAAAEQVFDADFAGRRVSAPTGDDLVWSPDNSQADMVALIDSARNSVLVESEELSAPSVVGALVAAARRGVGVGVVMTDDVSWQPDFDRIVRAGGRVSVLHGETPLYIHAKLLVVDAGRAGARALVGSQNISTASLDDDRELGIVLTDPTQVAALGSVVEGDARRGRPWVAGSR